MFSHTPQRSSDRLLIQQADITTLKVDAIVNAANSKLNGGGGVDGAIHEAAGPDLLEECLTLNGCETGQAKYTKAYQLHARYVIHTVGPVWQGGEKGEAELLASCYRESLKIANDLKLHTVAFPLISTGVFGYPLEEAVRIAINTIKQFVEKNKLPEKVIITCNREVTYQEVLSIYNKH